VKLLVVGASGLAEEVLAAVRASGTLAQAGVLDDDERRWGTTLGGAPVLGGLDRVRRHPDHRVLVCVGRGRARRAIVERLTALRVDRSRYATVIHPSVHVPAGCSVGRGSVLLAGAVLTADVRVGEHVVVMPHATLTHGDVLEDYATVCAGVSLGGRVVVGPGAYLGMNASVREDRRIGADATLGMGAALTVDLPARQTWVGVPARPVRQAGEAIA